MQRHYWPFLLWQIFIAVLALAHKRVFDELGLAVDEGLGVAIILGLKLSVWALAFCLVALCGRHWLRGLFAGSSLVSAHALAFYIGSSLYWYTRGGTLQLGPLGNVSWYLSDWPEVLVWGLQFPIVLASGCIALHYAAGRKGWQICDSNRKVWNARHEDFRLNLLGVIACLSAIACVPALWIVADLGGRFELLSYFGPAAGTSFIGNLACFFLVSPILWAWFHYKNLRIRIVVLSGIFLIIVGSVALLCYLVSKPWDTHLFKEQVAMYSVAVGAFYMHLTSLSVSGLRIVAPIGKKEFEQLANESFPASESAKVDFDQGHVKEVASKGRLVRARIYVLMTIALLIGLPLAIRRYQGEPAPSLAELRGLALERGGVLEPLTVDGSDAYWWKLRLQRELIDEDLRKFSTYYWIKRVHLANLVLGETAAGELAKFKNLTDLKLEEVKWTELTTTELLDKLSKLRSLELSGSSVGRQTIQEVLSYDRVFGGTLKLDSVPIRSLDANEVRLAQFESGISARSCGLNDELARVLARNTANDLDLAFNDLSGDLDILENRLPDSLIDMSGNPLQDELLGPHCVDRWIPNLIIEDTSLTDSFLSYLAKSTTIAGLSIRGPGFTEKALGAAKLPVRHQLKLSGRQFTGRCFVDWRPRITVLSMADTSLDDASIDYLSNLQWLRSLNISNTEVTAKALIASKLPSQIQLLASRDQFTSRELLLLENRFERVVLE